MERKSAENLPNYPLGIYRVHDFYNLTLNRWQRCPIKVVPLNHLEYVGPVTYAVYECHFPECAFEERVPLDKSPQNLTSSGKDLHMPVFASVKLLEMIQNGGRKDGTLKRPAKILEKA